ncbi:class I SAM-dependent methyltransferase [Aquirhabdus parva]|uniref:Class I SAM-dependent methyltransferase n=1 Tax=Aquirhabdus parva TaxID=2283318 RepID=A0A345P404_9GAMM|nr:class I SAM-dependent methyltransferase [Aquirhabdus parva]AXI02013.1 class I SAM-dependent methyltransferase [Aquirhabdus parva]
MSTFKDHFSSLANAYATFRPDYPNALFTWLSSLCVEHELAWDCATGNGQAAKHLAQYFTQVAATDASVDQITQATGPANVQFSVAPAEHTNLPDQSVDLLVVAQAVHWFDFDAFYAEAKRVLKPQGVIALITYAHHRVDETIDVPSLHYYHDIIGNYWPPERKWVENLYRDLPFPFEEISAPTFKLEAEWSLPHFIGYQATWSATKQYMASTGHNPIPELEATLRPLWGKPETLRKIEWPIALRVGRVH